MTINDQKWNFKQFFWAFFPIRLLIVHAKNNFGALIFWIILFLIVNDSLGYAFGVPFLFLSPEYLGEVSPVSFCLLGFGFGGFIMAFNTYSYIRLGPRFPFMTGLSKPFFKFCINNGIIPSFFVIFYLIHMASFQAEQELADAGSIIMYIFTTLMGVFTFFILSFFYFFRMHRRRKKGERKSQPIRSLISSRKRYWYELYELDQEETFIYFGKGLRLLQSRSVKHLDREVIENTFAKNRINASVFELLTISLFFMLGLFNGHPIMEVPAALSIVLLLTIIMMVYSALRSWFGGWVYPILVGVILGMNLMSSKTDVFDYRSYAYGLDYEKATPYNHDVITALGSDSIAFQKSKEDYIATLEKWKKATGKEKPKLVILATSGGGSRSALWTLSVLQRGDKSTEGSLSNNLQFIAGASGGMVGAAYFRELMLRHKQGKINTLQSPKFRSQIGKDMLNRLSFMATTNDIFIRYQKCSYNGHHYTKDRGYAWEQELLDNTDHCLDHSLDYYTLYEKNAIIPTMAFTPTIINDGRRMYIGSRSLSFLTYEEGSSAYENIDYHSLFRGKDPGKMRFSSVLRSNATFPFVMPMVSLPTEPQLQLMDAGIRDNYGGKAIHEFLSVFDEWIGENTSGVVIIYVRDTKKILDNEQTKQLSFIDKLTMPFGNIYSNFPRVQDYNQEELYTGENAKWSFPLDLISFNLREKREDRISLSWHLTKQEKIKIHEALDSKQNKEAFEELTRLLK